MNLKRYEFTCSEDRLEYYFDSVGPKGVIRKVVKFRLVLDKPLIFNIGFGDYNERTMQFDDLVISNNGDRDFIMATLAAIVLEFVKAYPEAMVFARGVEAARTRLYQMNISAHLAELSLMFEVLGCINGKWERFKINTTYEEFLVEKL